MSDDYIIIIPEMPEYLPDPEIQSKCLSYFHSIVPDSTEISNITSNFIQFVNCGENFEYIKCPSCNKTLDVEIWQCWMSMDYAEKGFNLNFHKMFCCGIKHTLHELKYQWPQGFAKYQLSALNSNIGQISNIQRRTFEKLLACPVRIIYRRY